MTQIISRKSGFGEVVMAFHLPVCRSVPASLSQRSGEPGGIREVSLGAMRHADEQHYTPEELGKLWHLDASTIRRIFRDESGVLVINHPEKMHKRVYRSIRIPASVAAR